MDHWLIWSLLSAVFAGLTAILAKIGVAGVDSNIATAIRTVVILAFTWAIALALHPRLNLSEIPRKSWLFLLLSGIATGLSWLCYFRALQLGEASKVAPIDKLSVVFAMVLAVVVLKENVTLQQWIGAGLILTGALVLALSPGR